MAHIDLLQNDIATNPQSGYYRVYFKSDGFPYFRNNAGTETAFTVGTLGDYVTIATAQTITGPKTFTGLSTFNGDITLPWNSEILLDKGYIGSENGEVEITANINENIHLLTSGTGRTTLQGKVFVYDDLEVDQNLTVNGDTFLPGLATGTPNILVALDASGKAVDGSALIPAGVTSVTGGDGVDSTGGLTPDISVDSTVARKNIDNLFSTGQNITGALTTTGIINTGGDIKGTNATATQLVRTNNTGWTGVAGGLTTSHGGNIVLYGGAHATLPEKLSFRTNTAERMWLDPLGLNVLVPVNVTGTLDVTGDATITGVLSNIGGQANLEQLDVSGIAIFDRHISFNAHVKSTPVAGDIWHPTGFQGLRVQDDLDVTNDLFVGNDLDVTGAINGGGGAGTFLDGSGTYTTPSGTGVTSVTGGDGVDSTGGNTPSISVDTTVARKNINNLFSTSQDITGDLDVSGDASLIANGSRVIGGFGTVNSGGVQDWDDVSNSASGSGFSLLGAGALNKPDASGISFWYPFTYEHVTKDGTSNRTQMAIPYQNLAGATGKINYRSYYNTGWSDWSEIVSTNNGTKDVDIGGDLGVSGDATFTKIIVPNIVTTPSVATLTIDASITNQYNVTALAVAMTIAVPTLPTDGQTLKIRIKDNGTARALTWNAIFRAIGTTLPTATTASKTIYVGAIYNLDDTKWDIVAVSEEA
tara:strand:+ start:14142 stop:16244 length:2103 start_codon:yes stop_codon:yes gene_type:complete